MTKNNKKGFTIIEVVLVLAIAGLIFLMVFIALPALQRSQRNTRRRQDMARILSAVNDYQSNNNGKSPATLPASVDGNTHVSSADSDFVIRYIDDTCTLKTGSTDSLFKYTCTGDQFKDPDGSEYEIEFDSGYAGSYWGSNINPDVMRSNHRMMMAIGLECSGDESKPFNPVNGYPQGRVALAYVLEGGAVYCGDNQ